MKFSSHYKFIEHYSKQFSEKLNLVAENEELRRQGAAKRKEDKAVKYVDVNKIPEWRTRQLYINLMLKEAGWDFDTNVEEEYPIFSSLLYFKTS